MTQKWYIMAGTVVAMGCTEAVTGFFAASQDADAETIKAKAIAGLLAVREQADHDPDEDAAPFLAAVYGPFDTTPPTLYQNLIAL